MIDFIDTVDTDTPMGLLRGIKYGTETYHTLFMRLCRSVHSELEHSGEHIPLPRHLEISQGENPDLFFVSRQ